MRVAVGLFWALLLCAQDDARLAQQKTRAAVAALAQGHYDAAGRHAEEAAQLARKAGLKAAEGRAHNELGNSEVYRGRYERAVASYRTAVRLARESGSRADEVSSLNNIGSTLFFQGNYGEAWTVYAEAREVTSRHAGAAWLPSAIFKTAVNQATVLQRLGRDTEAAQIYRDLEAHRDNIPPAQQAQMLSNLGVIYRRLGDPVKAMELYRRALDLFNKPGEFNGRARVLKNVAIAQAIDYGDLAAARRTLAGLLALSTAAGNKREQLQSHLYLAEAAFRGRDNTTAGVHWSAALAQARPLNAGEELWKALFGLSRIAAANGDTAAARERLAEAIGEIEKLRSGAGSSSQRTEFLAGKRDVYDARIASLLGGGSSDALLEAMEQSRARGFQETRTVRTITGARRLLADGELLLVYWAGPRETAVLWVNRADSGVVRSPAASRDGLLRGIAPLADTGTSLVTIVPDGWIAGVAVDALTAGGGRLIEAKTVRYLPSTALLGSEAVLSRPAAIRWPWSVGVLAAGGVSPARGRGLPGDDRLPPLPHTAEEARQVAAAMPGRSMVLLGELAQAAAIGMGAPSFPILHLAAHAMADEDAARSRVLLAGPPLYQRDMTAMKLQPGSLVVLSACRTAQGVDSLAAAMLRAGAGAVVASLEPVEDRAARAFMGRFYTALASGQGAAAALRGAKRDSIREGLAAASWAPFVLYGGDHRYAAFTSRTSVWLFGSGGLLLLAAALIGRRAR